MWYGDRKLSQIRWRRQATSIFMKAEQPSGAPPEGCSFSIHHCSLGGHSYKLACAARRQFQLASCAVCYACCSTHVCLQILLLGDAHSDEALLAAAVHQSRCLGAVFRCCSLETRRGQHLVRDSWCTADGGLKVTDVFDCCKSEFGGQCRQPARHCGRHVRRWHAWATRG